MKNYLLRMKASGKCPPRKPTSKIFWSWLGAFFGIYLVALLTEYFGLLSSSGVFIVGSFGASAVLIYGAPMADFSQPRNLVGGHVISALIGVFVYMSFGQASSLACAIAVSLAIVAMHFTRTLHPPGGATALIAVTGGERIHALGYHYAFLPIMMGAVIMLLVALCVNNLSGNPQRHYPVYWY